MGTGVLPVRSQAVVFLERRTPDDEWEKVDARIRVFYGKDDVESERPTCAPRTISSNNLEREGIEVVTPW